VDVGALPSAGLTALQALRDHGSVQPGRKVLINGASGGRMSLGRGPLPHTAATIATGFLRLRPVKFFISKCRSEVLVDVTITGCYGNGHDNQNFT
jgi:hypothetical protein